MPPVLRPFLAALVLVLAAAPATGAPAFDTYGHPALEAIDHACRSGEISETDAVLYRLYFLKDQEKLPARFRIEGAPLKCATATLLEIYEYGENAPLRIREEIAGYRSRPYLPNSRETAHFMIHYTFGGADGVPDEAWVDVVAEACELGWESFHNNHTWDLPPGDGSIGGGVNKIDCYIHNLGGGILGLAEPENLVSGGEPYDFTGYFHVNNTIANSNQRRVTVVHEYMHVVQFGYYGYSTFAWYMENSAMMGEEYAYDNINDYRGYLTGFFAVPYKSLKTHNGVYEYGQIVWPMYQVERFDVTLHELIWDNAAWSGNMFTATDEELAPWGYDLHSGYREFMLWCFYTNTRYDGNHFEEANTWTAMFYPNLTLSSYPTGDQHPNTNMRPEGLGTSIMKFVRETGDPNNTLVVDFDGPDCTYGVDFIGKADGANVFTEYSMVLDGSGNGQFALPGFNNMEYVFMMTHMRRECNVAQDYLFSADTQMGGAGAPDGGAAGAARVWPSAPNPFTGNTAIAYSLGRESRVTVRIFDAGGRLRRHLLDLRQPPGRWEAMWDGADDAGEAAGSGVYFAHISIDGQTRVEKVTRLR